VRVGDCPFPLHPQYPPSASASLRTISLDDSEHLLHNHRVSVASLRLLFTFAPERRSACHRNERSPSPEYPIILEKCYKVAVNVAYDVGFLGKCLYEKQSE